MFITHLEQRVDSSKGLELFMNYYVGNIQTHYSRPFVGLGSTRGDWPRLSARLTVYTRITGLPYPVSECPLTQIPAARCYGEYYDYASTTRGPSLTSITRASLARRACRVAVPWQQDTPRLILRPATVLTAPTVDLVPPLQPLSPRGRCMVGPRRLY